MSVKKHGVYASEVPTSLLPPRRVSASLPVVIGTAPIFKATAAAPVNEPVLIYTAKEAAAKLGYEASDDFNDYTLSEYLYAAFALYGVGPVVCVNVFDPATHKTAVAAEDLAFVGKIGQLAHPGVVGALVLTPSGGGTAYSATTDYSVDLATGLVTLKTGSAIAADANVKAAYSYADPSKVVSADIIGGIDLTSGKPEGLECVGQVFPRFRLIPGVIIAPKYSTDPAVSAVIGAKCQGINGHFRALGAVDIPTTGTGAVTDYTDVPAYKVNNNIVSEDVVACWPKGKLGDKEFHGSTLLAAGCGETDADNDDIPYASPSNHDSHMVAAVIAGGEAVYLDTETAGYLNANGIFTLLNFIGGWKLWGNRTAAYPDVTDVKDVFIPIRRMFNWVGNTLITTFFQKIDAPITKRLIETITDSANVWLNGLAAREYILGGRVVFDETENPTTDLMDGIIRFHVYLTPPSPAEEIHFILEYDPAYIATLFE